MNYFHLFQLIISSLVVLLDVPSICAVRNIQVVFPLQSLTIWDPEVTQQEQPVQQDSDGAGNSSNNNIATDIDDEIRGRTFRSKFLSKFRVGLQAEIDARNNLSSLQQQQQSTTKDGTKKQSKSMGKLNWAEQAATNDYMKHRREEEIVEKAYDDAILAAATKQPASAVSYRTKNPNRYQFVGVINNSPTKIPNRDPPIVWYSRKKPKNAKWTIRLIHVNRQAILKDLYNRKKIDIFVQYNNVGSSSSSSSIAVNETNPSTLSSSPSSSTYKPIVTGQYHVRERSWRNLWNMSLKHMLTDSSGMYWRERRIHSSHRRNQLYTDGNNIYEATYRYIDGRNGMHKVSSLQEYLNSRTIDPKKKEQILHRLANDVPDLVLEE